MTEPFVITKTNVKLKSDEVKVINTSGQSSITIKTPSQINKPLSMVVHKHLEPPKSINIIRMGNTTVKPVRQFITRVPTVSSNPSLKLVLDPKQNEARSLVRASGDYVKQLETDNNNLQKLLTEVRRESIGVQQKMIKMQETIDKILQRKPVPTSHVTNTAKIPTIPSFSITEVSTLLQFEKDLANKQFFPIVFQRILKTCKFYLKNFDVLGTCLKVLISKDIFTHFEWDSISNEYHSLSKCENFLNLFYKLVEAVTYDKRLYTRLQVEEFLRKELMNEPKASKCTYIQMSKFPKLSKEQTCVVRKPTLMNAKVVPNRLLVRKIPHRIINNPVPTTRTTSIGIDDADLQNEITSSEIDLNLIKDSEQNHNGDEYDIEMQDSKIDDDYEEPEIDINNTNADFKIGDSDASIIELNNDATESGFEIVNC